MTASSAELVQVRYQKLKNVNCCITEIGEGHCHEHSSMELGLVLSGAVVLECGGNRRQVVAGGLMLTNAYESHTVSSKEGAQVLFVQLASGFGKAYFARIASVEFDAFAIQYLDPQVADGIRKNMLSAAEVFFAEPIAYGLECAGYMANVVATLLRSIPHRIYSDAEVMTKKKKAGRYQRIANFIDRHYREKLTLSHLAKSEGVTSSYMSRIFAELFNKTFQDYLSELRLYKAIPMLKNPDIYLVDICMECGISDPRYLNAVCKKIYGCSAMQLREMLIRGANLSTDAMVETEQLSQYSDDESLNILHKYTQLGV